VPTLFHAYSLVDVEANEAMAGFCGLRTLSATSFALSLFDKLMEKLPHIIVFIRMLPLLACLFGIALPLTPAYGGEPVRIGVLAYRPKLQTLAQWQPLAAALKQAMPERDFVVEAFTFPELDTAVAGQQLDFVLTNPGHYVLLSKRSGLSAPLATVAVNDNGLPTAVFGGVIFSRAGQANINTLSDIKGKTIAATSTDSFGGYQMEAYELNQAGVRLPQDAKLVVTGMPHDNVVEAVLAGRADAGFVRSGVLEGMAREGRLDMAQLKIFNSRNQPNFSAQISTRLYPEWPFASLPHVDGDLARHVTGALFLLEHNTAVTRAMNIYGFAVPADYTPVADLLKELRLPPFDAEPEFSLADLWRQYQGWIVAISALALLLIGGGVNLVLQNRKVRQSEQRFATLFALSPEPMWIIADRRFIDCNLAAIRMLGFSDKSSALGLHPADISPRRQADGEYSQAKADRLIQAAENGATQSFEWVHLRTDGGKIICIISLARIMLNGKPVVLCSGHDITERKRMEEARTEALSRLQKIASRVPGVVYQYRLHPDGRSCFPFASEAIHDIYRVSPEEVREDASKVLAILHPEDCGGIDIAIRQSARDLTPWCYEYRVKFGDGTVRWLLGNALPEREADGSTLWHGFITDITERKMMEGALRESENKLATILDNVDAFIYIKDCNYQYQYANKAVRQVLGRSLEDIIGKWDDAFFDETTAAKLRKNDRSVLELGERIAAEDTYIQKGSAIASTYLTVKQPLRREDGRIYGLCGISTDITERKQIENALRDSEFRWKFAIEGSGDGLWDWDVANGTVFFTKRWKEMLGFAENEIGNSLDEWSNRIHPDDKADALAVVQAYFDGKIPVYTTEHRVSCKDGSYKWILDRGIVVSRDADGKPLRMIGTHTDINEYKQMEEKLRDSDAFNVSVLNSLTSHIAVLDAQGVIVAANNAWRQFAQENGLLKSSQDMLGFNYLEACNNAFNQPYGDEASAVQDGITAVLDGEREMFHLEYLCHSANQQHWFYMNVLPLHGSRRGVVVSHKNITERKKAEEIAQAASQYARSLIEASLDPLVTISAEGKVTDVNTATEQVTGVYRDTLIGSDFADYFTDPDKARAGYRQVFSQSFVTDYPLAIRHLSGKVTDVLYNASLYHDGDGKVLGVFAAARDITERKKAEEIAQAASQYARSLIEASLDPLVTISAEGKVTDVNTATEQVTGVYRDTLIGSDFADYFTDPDKAREGYQRVFSQGFVTDYPLAIRHLSGKVTDVLYNAGLYHDGNGKVLGVFAAARDITERKKIEAELTRSNAELEQFAYAVSHDMRQPLRMVSSYLALIEKALAGQLNEETQQCIDFAVNGAKRMDAMILSLLDYSRIGRVFVAKTSLSSKASLNEALAFLNPELSACGGKIKVTGDWPELVASRDELTRLLQNLIGNALKYHEENQAPQVDVHGAICAGSLRVEVRDRGIGIDPGQRDRLFKVFSRLQARSRFDGSGVGLALCRKIVEHHGGTIGVESEGEGQGCMFWFELPIVNAVNSA